MVREVFAEFGNIESVDLVKDKNTGNCKGFCFITFDDYDPVDKAVLKKKHNLNGKVVEVKKAQSKGEGGCGQRGGLKGDPGGRDQGYGGSYSKGGIYGNDDGYDGNYGGGYGGAPGGWYGGAGGYGAYSRQWGNSDGFGSGYGNDYGGGAMKSGGYGQRSQGPYRRGYGSGGGGHGGGGGSGGFRR